MEVGQEQAGVPDGWQVVATAAPPPKAPSSSALAETRMPTGVPARGRGTQFDPEKAQRGVDLATTPLAHPTGIGAIDSFTSPIGMVSLAAGGAGIARAGLTEGVAAAAKAAASEASPVLKFEVARRSMHAIGIPDAIASPIAMVIAGYKKGPKGEPVAKPSAPDAPHLDLSKPARPAGLTTAQMAERDAAVKAAGGLDFRMPKRGADGRPVKSPIVVPEPVASPASPAASGPVAPVPPVEPVARTGAAPSTPETQSPARNSLPDQKALNEEALARRRAEYQARQIPEPTPAKAKLTAPESKEYMRLRQAGKTHPEAMDLIEAQRVFQERFGLSSPSVEDTKFPKGNRGKTP